MVISLIIRRFSTNINKFPGRKIKVKEANIHYEQVGTGPHHLLLLPGAAGTTRTDFQYQLDNLNRNKFTLIAWDPPGYGFSTPYDRKFDTQFYRTDAEYASAFMKELKIDNYSIFGWSDGGITGLIMAATNPKPVKKLVALAASAFVTDKDVQYTKTIRDLSLWSDKMKAPMVKVYGEEYLQKLLDGLCDAYAEIHSKNGGNICREDLVNIKCETLIVQGDQDPIVDTIHPQYLKDHIENSRYQEL